MISIVHTKITAKTYLDNSSRYILFPTLLLEYNGTVRILQQLYEYQLRRHAMSKSWHDKLVQAVGLLLDYMEANQDYYTSPNEFYRSFEDAIFSGTIGENGYDKSGLYWIPKRIATGTALINALNVFSDWLHSNYGANQLNPWIKASSYEEKLNLIALANKSQRSLLGHLDSSLKMTETARKVRDISSRRKPLSFSSVIKAFPEESIDRLIWEGFKKTNKINDLSTLDSYNWRDMAITILQHGGGLRHSEIFHLWTQDVMHDPFDSDLALVRIYHPSEGASPQDLIDPSNGKHINNREAYILLKYGLKPRNKYISGDIRYAGWKNPKLDNEQQNYMQVHWFPKQWGYIFMKVWRKYLEKRMHEGITDAKHPYAFVSFHHKNKGDMLSISANRESHAKAVEKIGLPVSKANGTTEHGHRHAFGQRLSRATVDRRIIQAALHHKSDESQNVYTQPTVTAITNSLNKATKTLENGIERPMEIDIEALFDQENKAYYRRMLRRNNEK